MVTLKEIARRSGVSTATASYVLNNGPKAVLPETRERVLKVMNELGYRPNAAARGLKKKRTHTLGVVFPHVWAEPLDNEYYSQVWKGIVKAASARKQVLMIFAGMTWAEIVENVPSFLDGRCDGFLFLAPPANSPLIQDILSRESRVVLVGSQGMDLIVSAVDSDNIAGGKLAADYLISLGHKKIGMIMGEVTSTSALTRRNGFKNAIISANLDLDESLLWTFEYDETAQIPMVRRIVGACRERGMTALFCGHDSIAELILREAPSFGLRIPEDLSVVGFDDLSTTAHTNPPLTTIRQSMVEIGAAAVQILLDLIDEVTTEPTEKLFDVYLIERESTAAPSKAHQP
jgi:DNA-binding LacI/PurR family transcriptional regulator